MYLPLLSFDCLSSSSKVLVVEEEEADTHSAVPFCVWYSGKAVEEVEEEEPVESTASVS
jgi:hypothetical protein